MRERLVLAGLAGQTLGRYEIVELVGGGGMSTVYKAYDSTQDQDVALKVLDPALAQQGSFSERFAREANLVVQLNHPNIVPVYDFGKENGYSYLVMPYLNAGTLGDYIQGSPLTLAWIAEVMDQLAGALEYAHRRGVVHRDLKPSNILLDEQGQIMLADFGVARIRDSDGTLTGSMLLGTPAYISPEQALSNKVDHRSDQYSLGVLLFQLSTGQLPFVADTPAAVLLKHINEPLPLPSEINPDISEPVERVILKSTAKLPNQRFSSVAKLNEVFQMAVAHVFNPRAHSAPTIALAPAIKSAAINDAQGERSADRGSWFRRVASTGWIILLLIAILPICALSATSLQSRNSNTTADGSLSVSGIFIAELTAQAEIINTMATEIAETLGDKFDPEEIQRAVSQTLEAEGDGNVILLGNTASSTTNAEPSGAQPTSNSTPTQAPGTTPVATITPTITPTSSNTPITPPAPTLTSTIVPSPTQTTPPVVVENVCDTSALTAFSVSDEEISWAFSNNGTTTIEVTEATLDWPNSNKELKKVKLGGGTIWDKKDKSSPTSLASDWEGGSRQISSGGVKELNFKFDKNAASSGYSLTITLNDSCQISTAG